MHIGTGAIIGGKYQLDWPVSRGGMGAIWAGRHLQLGSPVAVKFMDPMFADSPAFRARFEREARMSASLKSPHVVAVQDYGIDSGIPFIVMELLQGEDLHTRLERRGRLSLAEISALLVQLGKALRRAHEAGFVHRDLKPRNIFLARGDDDDEVLKVLDFGIAKEVTSRVIGEATKTGEIVGSPHYMSPEQLRADKDLDARADLWSVGVILFRCVTGHLPFPGEVLGTVMSKILVDPIPLVSSLTRDLPPALDAFFGRALARDRTRRFQSAREMVDAFVQLCGDARMSTIAAAAPTSSVARGTTNFGQHTASESLPPSDPRTPGPPSTMGLLPGATAGAFTPATLAPSVPAETLTAAGSVATDPHRARRIRVVWVAGITTLLLSTLGTITVVRFGRHGEPRPGGAGEHPVAAEDPPAEAAASQPSLVPAPTLPAASEAPTAQPSLVPAPTPPAASEAPTAQPAEKRSLDVDAKPPSPKASAQERKAQSAETSKPGGTKPENPNGRVEPAKRPAPAASASKKPSWGF